MSAGDIRLVTYEDSEPTELDKRDLIFLQTEFKNQIRLRRHPTSDVFTLNPRQFAGTVRLPSGCTLRSKPRIDSRNLFYMLAIANSLPDRMLRTVPQLAEFDQVLELVASYFADLLEERIEQGLYRAYVEIEENLPVVRGRVHIAQDIRNNYVLRNRVFCRFTEYSWDVPENQVLRYVTHLLTGWPFGTAFQTRLQHLDRRLEGVSRAPHTANAIDRFSYSRMNLSYQPLHRLARLLLEEMSLSEDAGAHEFCSFLLDMNVLFERFIGTMFEQRFPPSAGRVGLQQRTNLGRRLEEDQMSHRWGVIKPDVLIRRGNVVRAVVDTKFKRTRSETINNPDFYQVLSYCVAMGTRRGALVYPRTELERPDEIRIANSDITVGRFSMDLRVPARKLLDEARELVAAVVNWIETDDQTGVAVA